MGGHTSIQGKKLRSINYEVMWNPNRSLGSNRRGDGDNKQNKQTKFGEVDCFAKIVFLN
jgi:hypothetical protein